MCGIMWLVVYGLPLTLSFERIIPVILSISLWMWITLSSFSLMCSILVHGYSTFFFHPFTHGEAFVLFHVPTLFLHYVQYVHTIMPQYVPLRQIFYLMGHKFWEQLYVHLQHPAQRHALSRCSSHVLSFTQGRTMRVRYRGPLNSESLEESGECPCLGLQLRICNQRAFNLPF